MVLEIAGTPDCMEADDAAIPDYLRLVLIHLLKFQAMRTSRRVGSGIGLHTPRSTHEVSEAGTAPETGFNQR